MPLPFLLFFFFFNDTATTEIYTLSLHDALPISLAGGVAQRPHPGPPAGRWYDAQPVVDGQRPQIRVDVDGRSEEHTSELQSQSNLVCRLLLEKKKKQQTQHNM